MNDRGVLVDTNVLLDVLTGDPRWAAWSESMLSRAVNDGFVAINPIIYAEDSVGFERVEDVDEFLPTRFFHREELPYSAGFLAGKAYERYRRSGGTRRSPLADFYIGAHALVRGYTLLTRDRRRYETYFPGLELITP